MAPLLQALTREIFFIQGLTREEWAEKLAVIGAYIKSKDAEITIEVIGSWAAIESGMPGRTSEVLDVWTPNSRFDRSLFRDACLGAGLDFDPVGEVDRPYIQLVRPGITQVPQHDPEPSAIFGGLILVTPPPAAIIASKLVRASDKDLHDIVFLKQKFNISTEEVTTFVQAITNTTAQENVVYLDFHAPLSGTDESQPEGENQPPLPPEVQPPSDNSDLDTRPRGGH